ncbi:MAG: potassium transporter TrkH, partial [Planctomycetota bacterium]|nr:potassium transporter TrkH [Planctomycetota bacterium]
LLTHSACLARGSRAILALGQSGAGKSTLARLCRQCRGWQVLGDEIHLLTSASVFRVHGTPWPGSSGNYAPRSADLAAVLLLEHGADNRLMPVVGSAAAAEI